MAITIEEVAQVIINLVRDKEEAQQVAKANFDRTNELTKQLEEALAASIRLSDEKQTKSAAKE